MQRTMAEDMAATNSVTVPSKALKAAFKALSSQVDQVRVDPQEDGWHIYGLSPDKASMANVLIHAEAFRPYEAWPAFAVMVDDVLEPLAKASDSATLDISKGYLSVTSGRINYRRPIMPAFEEYPRIPQAELGVEVVADVDVIGEVITAVSEKEAKSRGVTFTQTAESLVMESAEEDDPLHAVTVTIPRADCTLMEGEGSAQYSQRMLREIMTAVPRGTDVDVQYDNDYLMRISYTVEGADVVFVIAPWVENQE